MVGRQSSLRETYLSFIVIFFIPENEVSKSTEEFLVSILFHHNFCTKKLMVPRVPEVLEVPQSADPLFCNTRIKIHITCFLLAIQLKMVVKVRFLLLISSNQML